MNTITEYKIVSALSPKELSDAVNEMIKEGWQPTGGICIAQVPSANEGGLVTFEAMAYQAMIK
jgi:hypothetical protein